MKRLGRQPSVLVILDAPAPDRHGDAAVVMVRKRVMSHNRRCVGNQSEGEIAGRAGSETQCVHTPIRCQAQFPTLLAIEEPVDATRSGEGPEFHSEPGLR